MHEILLNGYNASLPVDGKQCLCLGTAGSYGIEKIHLATDSCWDGLTITATFHPPHGAAPVRVLVDAENVLEVPQEATAVPAMGYNPGRIVFSGTCEGVQRISADFEYTVMYHSSVEGSESSPTESEWAQLAAAYQSKVDKQQGAENAGKFLAVGEKGEVALSEGVKPEQIAAAVDAYLDENPIEAGATQEEAAQIKQNKEDIETLQKDKLSASELGSAIDSALAQAKASGEFDGKDGDPFTYDDFTEEQLAALKGKDGDDYVLTEADKQEIAGQAAQLVEVPEIPETLPNPNALTFTGAVSGTYDGSAPLTVEIPQGGSGGGTEFRLIRKIELTEDVTEIEVSEDEEGKPFLASEFVIFSKVIGYAENATNPVYLWYNNKYITNVSTTIAQTAPKYCVAFWNSITGFIIKGDSQNFANFYGAIINLGQHLVGTPINNFVLKTIFGGTFCAGSVIQIYGR